MGYLPPQARVLGFGSGFRVEGSGFWAIYLLRPGFRVQGRAVGLRVQGFGLFTHSGQGLGFRVGV